MKKLLLSSAIMATFALLTACGGDSGNSVTDKQEIAREPFLGDLPRCTSVREGSARLVEDEESVFVCADGEWVNAGEYVATEEEMPNCTSERKGSQVYVGDLEESLVCNGKKWVKYDPESNSSEDDECDEDMSSFSEEYSEGDDFSSSSEEEYSSSEEESSSSDVIACSSSDVIASSSGTMQSSSSAVNFPAGVKEPGYYDCDIYNCVTTDYLKSGITYGEILDTRDSMVYKVVIIGEQIWMAQNLNYRYTQETTSLDSSSFCYYDDPDYCKKYGRLYLWSAAMDSAGIFAPGGEGNGCGYGVTCNPSGIVQGICPDGWHLPSTTEWNTLFSNVSGMGGTGVALKSVDEWSSGWELAMGKDTSGFSALPAGVRDTHGDFYGAGNLAFFWSSGEANSSGTIGISLIYSAVYDRMDYSDKYYAYSVRCLRN